MAHRKNPRSLRQKKWAIPVFVFYAGRKDTREVWGKKLSLAQKRRTFFPKTFVQRKKNFFAGQKKNRLLLKDVRTTFLCSSYKSQRISTLSPNSSRGLQKRMKKSGKQKKRNSHFIEKKSLFFFSSFFFFFAKRSFIAFFEKG